MGFVKRIFRHYIRQLQDVSAFSAFILSLVYLYKHSAPVSSPKGAYTRAVRVWTFFSLSDHMQRRLEKCVSTTPSSSSPRSTSSSSSLLPQPPPHSHRRWLQCSRSKRFSSCYSLKYFRRRLKNLPIVVDVG
ncbi:hypothetical protein ACI65C_007021 [Semiaphis heraclei]